MWVKAAENQGKKKVQYCDKYGKNVGEQLSIFLSYFKHGRFFIYSPLKELKFKLHVFRYGSSIYRHPEWVMDFCIIPSQLSIGKKIINNPIYNGLPLILELRNNSHDLVINPMIPMQVAYKFVLELMAIAEDCMVKDNLFVTFKSYKPSNVSVVVSNWSVWLQKLLEFINKLLKYWTDNFK